MRCRVHSGHPRRGAETGDGSRGQATSRRDWNALSGAEKTHPETSGGPLGCLLRSPVREEVSAAQVPPDPLSPLRGSSKIGRFVLPRTSRTTRARPALLSWDQLKTIRSAPCSLHTSATRMPTGPGRSSMRASWRGKCRVRNSLPIISRSRQGWSSMVGWVDSVNTWRTMSSTSVARRGTRPSSTGREEASVPSSGMRSRRKALGASNVGGTITTGLLLRSTTYLAVVPSRRRSSATAFAPMIAASTPGASIDLSNAGSRGPERRRSRPGPGQRGL